MLIKLSTLFLLVLLVLASFTSARVTNPLYKARTFQTAMNSAISRQDERALSNMVSNWFTHDSCTGPDGDKRAFVQQLLRERQQGVVQSATESLKDIHFVVNYGTQQRRCIISAHALLLCRDVC